VLLEEVPLQKSNFSKRITEYPLEDASRAQPRPVAPPPIIIKSNVNLFIFNNFKLDDLFNFIVLF